MRFYCSTRQISCYCSSMTERQKDRRGRMRKRKRETEEGGGGGGELKKGSKWKVDTEKEKSCNTLIAYWT